MAKNDSNRQMLGREYYQLLNRMCDCHSTLTSIVRNASYSKSIKDETDPMVSTLRNLIESVDHSLQVVISIQMRAGITVEP